MTARLEYRHPAGAWPWAYHATQRFTLTPSGLTVELSLSNQSAAPMPAGLGWHPYFPRTPRVTITADVRAMLLTDACGRQGVHECLSGHDRAQFTFGEVPLKLLQGGRAQQVANLEPDDRHDRDQGVPQGMAHDDGSVT